MDRPISIASVTSLVLHAMAFFLLVSLVNREAEPELDNVLSVLHYQVGQLEDGETPSEPGADSDPTTVVRDQDTRAKKENPQTSKPVAKLSNTPSRIQEPRLVPVEQAFGEAQAAKAKPETAKEQGSSVEQTSTAVTTTSFSNYSLPKESTDVPAVQTVAMSSKQEKMLNKKLKRWSEDLYKMDTADSTVEWEHKGQEYKATFSQVAAESDTSVDQVMVEISTEENGRRLSTEMQMRRLAFSNFGQFINRWDPNVQIHNDEMDGRFHSNSEISLGYSRGVRPTFHGKVTTSSRRVNLANTRGSYRRDKMFLGGLETGVRRIQLPKKYLVLPTNNTADDTHQLEGDTRIIFHEDGGYELIPLESGSKRVRQYFGDTTYIIGSPKSKLFVSGVVNGKVLVYSPERIVIEGDLLYAQDPAVTSDGDDYLGLVSDKNVEIAHPDITGPGDLRIHASIYAKRRFSVTRYRARENSLLYIYGSLTAGSISATEPRYFTKIEFDKRLEKIRAPGFPVTNRYEMTAWDGKWRVD